MTPITISAIIPAYNAQSTIIQAIESLQKQQLLPLEILVVDDGSHDETATIVRGLAAADSRIRLIEQPNSGGARARLAGYDAARAEALYFLDADDVAQPNALSRLAHAMQANPQAVLCYGHGQMSDAQLRPIGKAPRRSSPSGDILTQQLQRNHIIMGSALIRKTALHRAAMDHTLRIGQDLVMWAQLAAAGECMFIGGAPIMLYRKHEHNVTRLNLANTQVYFDYIDWIFSYPPIIAKLSAQQQTMLRRRRIAATHSFIAKTALLHENCPLARIHAKAALRFDPLNIKLWALWLYSLSPVRCAQLQRQLFR